ncbi:MAG: tetratricopeptide repeat protein [Candidatus Dadabacteria bacterium]|nr:tetratricopeptide repeat protein [Candidatus Dadabacteria bacterium]
MSTSILESLKALVEKNPASELGRYGLANEYMKLEMYPEAIEQINEYLKLKDDEGAVYRMLAEGYMKLGRKDEAIEAYKKGIESANRHGHPTMAEEFEDAIEFMD